MGKAGQIVINLSAGTAQFIIDMERANGSVRDFQKVVSISGQTFRNTGQLAIESGAHTVTAVQGASAAIREAFGGSNIRAVERFISTTLGLGPVLQKLFPLVGAAATIGIIVEVGAKAKEVFEKIRDQEVNTAAAFRSLTLSIKTSADELQLANDRLTNDIDKLQGRRENGLKIALDEAVLSADKLGESLEKDLTALQKLLKEHEIGDLKAFMLDKASSSDIRERQFGKSGHEGPLGLDLPEIVEQEQDRIAAIRAAGQKAKTDEKEILRQVNAARAEARSRIENEIFNPLFETSERKIRMAQRAAEPSVIQGPGGGADTKDEISLEQKNERALKSLFRKTINQFTNDDLEQQKSGASANAENAKVGQPFQNEMAKLEAAYKGAVEKLNASGMSESAKTLAKAHAEAFKAITEVNKQLKEHHSQLTANQEQQIRGLLVQTVTTEAEATWRESLAKSNGEIQNRIRSQELLTAAIGKGYAATKAASVETQLMQAVGPERFNDDEFMQTHARGVNRLRGQIGTEFDKQNAQAISKATDALQDQIEIEKSLAAVQSAGADAINRVTLAYRLREIVMRGGLSATKEQIKAEMDLFNARQSSQSEKDLAGLNLEISGLQRLSAAQIQGAEAARQAALANEAAKLKFEGKSDAVVGAFLQKAELEHQTAILDAVLKTSNAARDRLGELADEEAAARSLQGTAADQLGLAIKLKEIDRERVEILSQQVQVFGGARDGMRAFFAEMATESISAARMVHDTLGNAFNSLNDTLAKVMTGQKVSWSSFFRQIGEDMSRLAVHQLEVEAVKKIGAIITARQQSHVGQKKGPMDKVMDAVSVALGGAGAVKRDGNTAATALYVSIVGTAGLPAGAVPLGQSASTKGAGGPDGSDKNPFSVIVKTSALEKIGGALKDFAMMGGGNIRKGGPHAAGGPVDPGYAYMVGERGPEMFMPTGAGTIIPNNALGGGRGSGNVYYNIDARNSDPVATEQRVRAALAATHKSAVMTSMRAITEQSRRTPRHA